MFKLIELKVIPTFCSTVSEPDHDKNRRGANMGLYAFPRVGRSDPSLVNNLHDASDSIAYEAIYGMSDDSTDDFDGKLKYS